VATSAVVEAFDVFEDRGGQFDAGVPTSPVEDLDLQARPKGFGDGVVVRVAHGAERGQQAGAASAVGEGPTSCVP
jgi:hypothetical protein